MGTILCTPIVPPLHAGAHTSLLRLFGSGRIAGALEIGFQRSPFSARFTESATLAIARYSALMPMARMTSPIWRIRHADGGKGIGRSAPGSMPKKQPGPARSRQPAKNAVHLLRRRSWGLADPESSLLSLVGTRLYRHDVAADVLPVGRPEATLLDLPASGARWLTIRTRNGM